MYQSGRVLAVLAVWMGCAAFAAPTDQTDFKLTPGERTILDLTNRTRAQENLPPLQPNPVLFRVARAHAANMATQRMMEHVLDGKNPGQRVTEAGYRWSHTGENIAWSTGVMLDTIFKGWLDSPPHRANIISTHYREIGIGVMRNDQGEVYYTQVFATQLQR